MRPAASNLVRRASLTLAVLLCAGCSAGAASPAPSALPSAALQPIWTAPPPGAIFRPSRPAASATTPALVDAASAIELNGTYHLVYRPNDTSLTDTLTAGLATSGVQPRAASREVWDATSHVGGLVVIDLVGMDLANDALTTFATTFATQAKADLTWTTIRDQRVGVVSQGEQRLELFLLAGDLVVVAGIQPDVADEITRSLIEQNP